VTRRLKQLASRAAQVVHARALAPIAPRSEARSFAQDVILGLSSMPKYLPCKYFYDAHGSQLFDRITELDEYYPTRTEIALMRTHVAEMARRIGPGVMLVELGSGSSVKTRLLLDALERPAGYVPVDISATHLQAAALSIATDYPELEVVPVAADFTRGFELPSLPASASRCVFYFPGSTIGNFTHLRAQALLTAIADCVGRGGDERDYRPGALLLGFDLVKSRSILEPAYDDALGVTAAFNRNLLARINRELDGNFVLDAFEHRAIWEPEPARMEIFLRSTRDQVAHAAGHRFHFAADEDILTEYSHKYTRDSITTLTSAAGFRHSTIWTDADELFGVGLFEV
jgi:dimethylhistidine N-methyltransferase